VRCRALFTGKKCPSCTQRYEQARREDPVHRFYMGAEWRACRASFLRDHPVCADCGGVATEADHLLSVRQRPDLALVQANLVARCKRDHSRRTSREHSWNR
jgi:5-methylcytosine-specific restriction protein A